MHRRSVVFGLALVGLAVPAFAILGLGDIVFDPNNFEQAIKEFAQLEQEYAQLVQTYQMVRSQYEQMVWMAKQVPVTMASRYRAIATPWTTSSATNTYGTTAAWVNGINTGQAVSEGYSAATEPLETYGSALANVPDDQQAALKSAYGTVELTDGANLAGIQTIGQIRGSSAATDAAIENLENDSLSSDPNMNTEIAVLNKINAANMIHVRGTQDTNKLLATLAEEQIIHAKRERDAEAKAFNNHIRFMTEGRAVMAAQAANASDAMLAWRMP